MKMFRSCVLLAGLAIPGIAAAHAQAIPAATQPGILTVGVDFSYGNTDIFTKKVEGFGIFANYDLGEHLSADVDVHSQSIVTPDDWVERSYLIGPRYNFHYGRYTPYVKVLAGIGSTSVQDPYPNARYPFLPAPGSFFAYSLGGGADVQIKGHWMARADIEQQFWPGFADHGLTPVVLSVGVGYHFRP